MLAAKRMAIAPSTFSSPGCPTFPESAAENQEKARMT